MAGAPCPMDVMQRVMKFAPDITIAYGMTEVQSVCRYSSSLTDTLVQPDVSCQFPNNVGRRDQ